MGICFLGFKAKCFFGTLINVHAQKNERTDEIKEEFYNLLEKNTNQIANSDFKLILGDFNAKVGKEIINKLTTVFDTLHNEPTKVE